MKPKPFEERRKRPEHTQQYLLLRGGDPFIPRMGDSLQSQQRQCIDTLLKQAPRKLAELDVSRDSNAAPQHNLDSKNMLLLWVQAKSRGIESPC